jgi:hypothetical protein
MNGNLSVERSSASIEAPGRLDGTMLLMLLGLGVSVVLVHQAFRFPMNLPGRHGLDAMFLMTIGMLAAGNRWAGTATGVGAGSSAWFIGGGALAPLLYPVVGFVFALAPRISRNWRSSLIVLPVVAALAWASRPIVRWFAAEATGVEFDSIAAGLLWPVGTHLTFGFIGAFGAVLVWRGRTKLRNSD